MYKAHNQVAETKLNIWMTQEPPSMPTYMQEMNELNHNLCHCTQHVAKEMTRLNHRVPQDMPSMTACRKEMNKLNPNVCPQLPHG